MRGRDTHCWVPPRTDPGGCRLQLNRDRQKPGGLLTVVAMQCFAGQWRRSEIRVHHNSKLASRRRQYRDDAIGDAGPRRLPLGRKCGFAQLADSNRILGRLQEIVVSEAAALLRSCATVSPLSSSSPLKGLSAAALRYGVWEARCGRPTF
jgi:hypothetical protein